MFERFVQRTYDALGRKDATQLLRGMAEDAVLELSGESTVSGRYRGRAEIEAFFGRLFERMEHIEPTVERVGFANPLGFNVRNTMYVEWHVSETTYDGLTIASDVISVFRMRAGKCILLREFWLDDVQLINAWGLKAASDTQRVPRIGPDDQAVASSRPYRRMSYCRSAAGGFDETEAIPNAC